MTDPRITAAAKALYDEGSLGSAFLAEIALAAADAVDPMRQPNDLSHLYVSRYRLEEVEAERDRYYGLMLDFQEALEGVMDNTHPRPDLYGQAILNIKCIAGRALQAGIKAGVGDA